MKTMNLPFSVDRSLRPASRRVRRRALRGFATALVFLALILAAGVVVMALSQQASSTRGLQEAFLNGRFGTELAESAIGECLAEFTGIMNARLGSQNIRTLFASKARGNIIVGPDIAGAPSWTWEPMRTLLLITEKRMPIQLSPVTIRPLRYRTDLNYGFIELSCVATLALPNGRKITRRVASRHYFGLDGDEKTLRVNAVGYQLHIDRSGEA